LKLHSYRYRAVPNATSIANLANFGNAIIAWPPPVYEVGAEVGVGEELLVEFDDTTIAACRVTTG